jgi:hypothetical protein
VRFHKDLRPIVDELRSNGYEVVPGGKHFLVTKSGKRIATLPGTPGDRRDMLNNRARLRRLGLIG